MFFLPTSFLKLNLEFLVLYAFYVTCFTPISNSKHLVTFGRKTVLRFNPGLIPVTASCLQGGR